MRHAFLLVVLTALPVPYLTQDKLTFTPVVPAADWRQADSHPLPLAAVSQYGGDPAVEREYGVKAIDLRSYQLGKTRLEVVVESALDATGAYGLLTFYRTPAMKAEDGVQFAFGDAHQAVMARGNNFIRFLRSEDSPVSDSNFQALLVFVGGSKPSVSEMRGLPHPMPAQGEISGSEKYLVGLEAAKRVLPNFRTDLIGFDQSAQVQLANYQTPHGTSTLISIEYPTPQIARVRFGSLSNLLGVNQDRGPDSIFGKRHHSYVFLVLNAGNQETASALMNQFDVTESVSWDKPVTTERSFTIQLVRMILAILLLTAILICACVVAGVLFFLSRRMAGKFFPNSQWGKTDEDQLIRLNLSQE